MEWCRKCSLILNFLSLYACSNADQHPNLGSTVQGDGQYAGLSQDGRSLYHSRDGYAWEKVPILDHRFFNKLSYDQGTFVATSGKVRFHSSDLEANHWTRDTALQGENHPELIPGSYIVMYDEYASVHNVQAYTRELAENVGKLGERIQITHVYAHAGPGFAADMSEKAANILREHPSIAYIQHDYQTHLIEPLVMSGNQNTTPSPQWNLDRIDQDRLPLDGRYQYPTTGTGVHAYIWDTGIRRDHAEFSGKEFGSSMDDQCPYSASSDHGTHVAGTVGGKNYGVAKDVTLHSVNAAGCEGAGIGVQLSVIDWIMEEAHNNHWRSVVNMSWGSFAPKPNEPDSLRDALAMGARDGVVFVAAAGNSGESTVPNEGDACYMSPAGADGVIAVGSYTINGDAIPGEKNSEARSYFSNFGPCVALFAPGQEILSAGTASATEITGKQGTSMAAPHVTGAAALYLELNPEATAEEVKLALIAASTQDVIRTVDLKGSPNRLLNINFRPEDRPDVGPKGYIRCTGEGGSCDLSGLNDVAYGALGKFNYQYAVSGNIVFDNSRFGDPIYGVVKSGYFKPRLPTDSVQGPEGFFWCAEEGEICQVTAKTEIAYGAQGQYFYQSGVAGDIACNNSTFRDPVPGQRKACFVRLGM